MSATSFTPAASLANSDSDNHHQPIRSNVPLILTVDEAAKVLTISKRKACDLIARGKLQSRCIDRRRIVTREAIEKFIGIKLTN